MGEELTCEYCGVTGTWDGGTDSGGNLYLCEGDCGVIMCTNCLEELHSESISEIEHLLCSACIAD